MKRPALLLLSGLLAAVVAAVILAITLGGGGEPPHATRTDETGTIEAEVPAAWSDVVAAPLERGDDQLPYLLVAPDVDEYRERASAPGLEVVVVPGLGNEDAGALLDETLARLPSAEECSDPVTTPFDRHGFVGRAARFDACPQGGSLRVVVAEAEAVDGLVVVGIQGVSDDLADEILARLHFA